MQQTINVYSYMFNKRLKDMKNYNRNDYWRLLICKEKSVVEKFQATVC